MQRSHPVTRYIQLFLSFVNLNEKESLKQKQKKIAEKLEDMFLFFFIVEQKVTILLIIICTLGTVLKILAKTVCEMEIWVSIKNTQITTFLCSTKILSTRLVKLLATCYTWKSYVTTTTNLKCIEIITYVFIYRHILFWFFLLYILLDWICIKYSQIVCITFSSSVSR